MKGVLSAAYVLDQACNESADVDELPIKPLNELRPAIEGLKNFARPITVNAWIYRLKK